jgi:hypothetical protein
MLHDDKASLMVRPEAVHPLHSNNPFMRQKLFYGSTYKRQAKPYLLVPLANIKFLRHTDCHQRSWPLQLDHGSMPFTFYYVASFTVFSIALAGFSRWEVYRLITLTKAFIFIFFLHCLPIFPVTPSYFLQMLHAGKKTYPLQRHVLLLKLGCIPSRNVSCSQF